MAQVESMDFFEDLFADVPYNSPSASSSSSSLFSSDSGHGSPAESFPSSSSDFSPKVARFFDLI